MACERYEDALTETAAGAPPTADVESHLAGCARCREELAELRRTLALVDSDLRQLVAVEPSPELAVRIRRAAAEASRRPRGGRFGSGRPWPLPLLSLLACRVVTTAGADRRRHVAHRRRRAPQAGTPSSGTGADVASAPGPAPLWPRPPFLAITVPQKTVAARSPRPSRRSSFRPDRSKRSCASPRS